MSGLLMQKGALHACTLDRLAFLYGAEAAPAVLAGIEQLVSLYTGRIVPRPSSWSERDAMLITYADSVIGNEPPLQVLEKFAESKLGQVLTCIHVLPFYPFTSDDGFSVTDFRAVDGSVGDWNDVERLSAKYRVVFDGVINHVSASSHYMQRYSNGDREYADFFVEMHPDTETSSVLRTRNLPLLNEFQTHEGSKWLWTTFSPDQVDLNYRNPKVLLETLDVLFFYAERGASLIRLDAIPYLWKELGTSCAHLVQTHELIKVLRDALDAVAPHVSLLTETNVPHAENVTYFGNRGDEAQIIYNFTLVPLILWSLVKGDAHLLTEWAGGLEYMAERATYLNITATHDGIGMRPSEGILTSPQQMELVRIAKERGGDVTGKRNEDGSISPYELNITYFDALNDPKGGEPIERQINRFMVSQAIPMALMGVPGIYIHSLVGSRNYVEGVKESGRARSINRERLWLDALCEELDDSTSLRSRVFNSYMRLLRLRREQSAFHPDAQQEILDLGSSIFAVRRNNPETGRTITAVHNITDSKVTVGLDGSWKDLVSGQTFSKSCPLGPYQFRWLEH